MQLTELSSDESGEARNELVSDILLIKGDLLLFSHSHFPEFPQKNFI